MLDPQKLLDDLLTLKGKTDAEIAQVLGDITQVDRSQVNDMVARLRVLAAAPQMLAALKKVKRALSSPEWKAWEGQAITMQMRQHGADAQGYTGEQFMADVRAALAAAEGTDAESRSG